MSIRGKCAIVGVGESNVGRHTGRSQLALQLEAATRAIADAGLTHAEIDGLVTRPVGHAFAAAFSAKLGLSPTYLSDVGLGGASSAAMIGAAVAAIEAGYCKVVLCVNGDAQTSRHGGVWNWSDDYEKPFGALSAPITYALPARRHMHEYGTTSEQFGAIAVACRKHAMLNPNAVARSPMTLADHQASRMIADPLRLFDCCPVTDGAAAVLVTSAERALDRPNRAVYVLGVGQHATHAAVQYAPEMMHSAARGASRQAYAMAGLGPQDIDTAQVDDAFTYSALVTLEDYGFCAKGEGGAFVEGGRIELGGELPVNTGGGKLSQAHAGGFFLITEAATQLRGVAGARQVADAQTAIVSGQCGVTGVNVCLILANER